MKNNIENTNKDINTNDIIARKGLVLSSNDLRDVLHAGLIGKWHHSKSANDALEDNAQVIVMSNAAERRLGGDAAKAIVTTIKDLRKGAYAAKWPSNPDKKYNMEVVFGSEVKVVSASEVVNQLKLVEAITGKSYKNNPSGMFYLDHKLSF
jgi:hypothetical protein